MAERSLRGTRLEPISLESEVHRRSERAADHEYVCPQGHRIELPFSRRGRGPAVWECRAAARPLRRRPRGRAQGVKHVRTHWDMLLERRSIPELEELLEERLALLRAPAARSRPQAHRLTRSTQTQTPCRSLPGTGSASACPQPPGRTPRLNRPR